MKKRQQQPVVIVSSSPENTPPVKTFYVLLVPNIKCYRGHVNAHPRMDRGPHNVSYSMFHSNFHLKAANICGVIIPPTRRNPNSNNPPDPNGACPNEPASKRQTPLVNTPEARQYRKFPEKYCAPGQFGYTLHRPKRQQTPTIQKLLCGTPYVRRDSRRNLPHGAM